MEALGALDALPAPAESEGWRGASFSLDGGGEDRKKARKAFVWLRTRMVDGECAEGTAEEMDGGKR